MQNVLPFAELPTPRRRVRRPKGSASALPRRRLRNIAATLHKSAADHMRTAIEFFNRPVQASRHEIAAVLAVAAWEKLLKAYLHRFTPTKIFLADGRTLNFDSCRLKVRNHLQLMGGHVFEDVSEHLLIMERYRNECVHFVGHGMSTALHGIFAESTIKFAAFLLEHFKRDLLPASDVGVLPVGYSFPLAAEDFIKKQSAAAGAPREVLDFLKAMHEAGKRLERLGVAPEHSVLVSYRLGLVQQKNAAKADAVVRVDNTQADAKEISVWREVDEKSWREHYCLRHKDVLTFAREKGIRQNKEFQEYLRSLKSDSDVFSARKHDPNNPNSQSTPCYSKKVYERLGAYYKLEL